MNHPLKGDSRQTGTIGERIITDTGHAVGYRYTRQAGASGERTTADTGHAVGYRYTRQAGTFNKRRLPDTPAYASFLKINGGYIWRGVTTNTVGIEQTCRYFCYVRSDIYRYTNYVSSGVIEYVTNV